VSGLHCLLTLDLPSEWRQRSSYDELCSSAVGYAWRTCPRSVLSLNPSVVHRVRRLVSIYTGLNDISSEGGRGGCSDVFDCACGETTLLFPPYILGTYIPVLPGRRRVWPAETGLGRGSPCTRGVTEEVGDETRKWVGRCSVMERRGRMN
jgi:hypothetical protein